MKKTALYRFFALFKNIYFLTGVFFIVWMAFFDSNNLLANLELNQKREELLQREAFYQEEIEKLKTGIEEINNDPRQIEKLAREKYLFKKKGEDVYVIEE